MKTFLTTIMLFCIGVTALSQHGATTPHQNADAEAAAMQQWIHNLYEVGVIVSHDTFTITEEARHVASDSVLRSVIYPQQYNWSEAQYLLKNMHIKVGLWHLINLYRENEANHEAVVKMVIGLEEVFDMQKALTAAFYTFIFFDPEASDIVNDKPVIHRPDILDEKLAAVRAILKQVMIQR